MKNKPRGILIPAMALLFAAAACKKDNPITVYVNPYPGKKVFVVNEGGFTSNDASVTLFDAEKSQVEENRYANQNSQEPLGDVAQSMVRYGDEYFIAVNNSNKIVVCDLSLKKKAVITGLEQPRYILPVGNSLAFVSQYGQNGVAVVNLATRAVVKKIPLTALGEEMVSLNDKVYLANGGGSYLYVLSVPEQKLVDSVFVSYGASRVVLDKNKKVWVMTQGNWSGPEASRLNRVNPETSKVEAFFDFSKQDYVSRLAINGGGDTLYYLHDGVKRMPITATALPGAAFISTGFGAYAIRVNHRYNHIYVSDAIDFKQRSLITIYSASGDSLNSFRAGRNAGDFLFD